MPAVKRTKKSTASASKTKRSTAKSAKRTSARTTTGSTVAKKSTRSSARASAASKTARGAASSTASGRVSATTKRTSTSAPSKKRAPSAAFMTPMQPDTALSAIVGKKPLPRTQVTKKLWNYIKKHDLQDANKRTMINADANLRPVFGGKRKIDMFQMTKMVSKHLLAVK